MGRRMALLLFAANMLVLDYLDGRMVPSALYCRVVNAVETRLLDGVTPVLDDALCSEIDQYAPPAEWGESLDCRFLEAPGRTDIG